MTKIEYYKSETRYQKSDLGSSILKRANRCSSTINRYLLNNVTILAQLNKILS